MTKRWQELRLKARGMGRRLKCPICGFRFDFRHLQRERACPKCGMPLGYSAMYRRFLMLTYLCVAAFVFYKGYIVIGPGILLLGWSFVIVAGFLGVSVVLAVFPPQLEPYAHHSTWLKLN